MRRVLAVSCALLLCFSLTAPAQATHLPIVLPSLARDLVSYYDFEHPLPGNPALERDRGRSGTHLSLLNGGKDMRVRDRAFPASRSALQLKQVNPTVAGNDDWKAGVWAPVPGVPTLHAFNGAREMSIMGWFKMTGQNPAPNSNSANPDDFYGAIGLAGLLSGDSNGHAVRGLLELMNVNGKMSLVALGRRVDGAASQYFTANADWQTLLPANEWVFLAATFNFDTGAIALYRNGKPVDGFYAVTGDPWALVGEPEPDLASPTDPLGIKIGGSYPQNHRETNACNCRMDSLMFLDRAVSKWEVHFQYEWMRHLPG
ncbi:LamG domain-containing protein [Lentzea tibetensis]|uniref:LamG domain-containing protein n=1 Tax=Lentzea tibetensis TaxID=2591470 RepID=A0A563EYZ9_9PSEU|nr:LamG-like jellyroll fold domain-containing protein [Lentzea tibetensis]TWP52711.1 LamG domain-containing protein [Lentzea tibetensis]